MRQYRAPSLGHRIDDVMAVVAPRARDNAILLDFGLYDPTNCELYITHAAGLYSCISVTLWMLADLLREGHLTRKINYTFTLDSYRDEPLRDLYPDLFVNTYDSHRLESLLRLPKSEWSRFDHHNEYRLLPYTKLGLLTSQYFQPNSSLAKRISDIRRNHIVPDKRYLGVCFRGTDKATEVMPIDSAIYLELADRLLTEKQVDRILIQTDQAQVGSLFQKYFGERCDLIERLPRTEGAVAIHNGAIQGSRLDFARDMISAVTLLAEMEQVIVYTGNIGVWIALLRGSSNGVWQATPNGITAQFQ